MNILNHSDSHAMEKQRALIVLGVVSARATDRLDLVIRLF